MLAAEQITTALFRAQSQGGLLARFRQGAPPRVAFRTLAETRRRGSRGMSRPLDGPLRISNLAESRCIDPAQLQPSHSTTRRNGLRMSRRRRGGRQRWPDSLSPASRHTCPAHGRTPADRLRVQPSPVSGLVDATRHLELHVHCHGRAVEQIVQVARGYTSRFSAFLISCR